MQTPRATEGRIPFFDVAVAGLWVDTTDAISVQFGVPDHPIDWRVVDSPRLDTQTRALKRNHSAARERIQQAGAIRVQPSEFLRQLAVSLIV